MHKTISSLYADDGKENGVCVIEARNFSFASPRLTGSINDNEKYGKKWISEENLLKVIPLFCAARDEVSENGTISDEFKDYRIVDTIYKSADGGTKYQEDDEFLQDCLLYALCSQKNACSSTSKFYKVAENKLDSKHKNTDIYKIYAQLRKETGLNGLVNIETYNKLEFGKLWKEHKFYPQINKLKMALRKLHLEKIRPKLLKYEILK